MKKLIFIFLLSTAMLLGSQSIFAQANLPSSHGATTDQSGASAPIGGGLFILLGLGAAYAGKKIYDYKNREPEV